MAQPSVEIGDFELARGAGAQSSSALVSPASQLVGIDVSALESGFKAHSFRGIGRYVQELKRYFDQRDDLPFGVSYFGPGDIYSSGAVNTVIDWLPVGRNTVRQQIFYPLSLSDKRRGFNIVHFPAHMDAPAWGMKNYIITVLDLIPRIFPELYNAKQRNLRFKFARWLEAQAIRNASLVLTISNNTAKDVHEILGVPLERILVTHLGVDEKFFSGARLFEQEKQELRNKYRISLAADIILYVGGIDQRKNIACLLRSFKGVLQTLESRSLRQPIAAPQLVLLGKIDNDGEFGSLKLLIKELGLEQQVVLPGFVEDNDLVKLLQISAVFFFPSLYEGFGLPPLEALAAGVPVVSSNTSSLPEVLGNAALYMDPKNPVEGAQQILNVLENRELATDMRARGPLQARQFSWSKTGDETLSAYERLLSQCLG